MRASIHLVDGPIGAGLRATGWRPSKADLPGLIEARTLNAAPLSGRFLPSPQFGRVALVGFWEDDDAIDMFEQKNPQAERWTGGWSARMEPLRAVPVAGGHFPGIPDDLPGAGAPSPTAPASEGSGPAAVLTIGRLRMPRIVSFLRTSAHAEAQVAASPGLLWATGLANLGQGVVATFSLWDSAEALRSYATRTTGHKDALRSESQRSFHHRGSFVRFRPYAVQGTLPQGRNPLAESVTAALDDVSPGSEGP